MLNSYIAITTEGQGGLNIIGGRSDEAYAQIGHGGLSGDGDFSGDIEVTGFERVSLAGGSGEESYSQLGHGGWESDSDITGNIILDQINDLSLRGGEGNSAYALVGHGTQKTASGDIEIAVQGSVDLRAGSADKGIAQVGHSTLFDDNDNANTIAGDITIQGQGELTVRSGDESSNSYAQIGHGSILTRGSFAGDITINDFEDVRIEGGDSSGGDWGSYSQLGHGGGGADGRMEGNILLEQIGDLSVQGGTMSQGYALLGHGSGSPDSDFSSGSRSGNITVNASGDITTANGADVESNDNHGWLGHSTSLGREAIDGNTAITANSWNAANGASQIDSTIGSMIEAGLKGGSVSVDLTGSDLHLSTILNYQSDDLLLMRSRSGELVFRENTAITNTGDGNVILASQDFHNDSGNDSPITVSESGRWLIYSTRPENNRMDDEMAEASGAFQYFGQNFDPEDPTPEVLPAGNGLVYVDSSQEQAPTSPVEDVDEVFTRIGDDTIGNGGISGGEGDLEIASELSTGIVEFEMENTEAPQEQVNDNESAGSDSSNDNNPSQSSQQAADCRAEPDRIECQQGQ